MFDEVRLVIWDLDETFWRGTLTEGGIQYQQAHHDIVVALARRGIISSICSKNDRAPVQAILAQTGLWDYFVFPSIDWSPKGPRLAAIVEAVQLRPATVLFVDDNPGNRAEAAAAVPGLMVCDESAIAGFLDHPGFTGKDDAALSRLQQYKLLETRHADLQAASGGNAEFLRQSGIRVELIHEIEPHIERAVELINRTNQLNFTKLRLPEEKSAAIEALREELALFSSRAGLVRVTDRYGDYGIVGFFLAYGLEAHRAVALKHFCFSCRTLGMGVEQWVYEAIGRPRLTVQGEVLSDPTAAVDWINLEHAAAGEAKPALRYPEVRIRGSCELEVMEHLFRPHASRTAVEITEPHGAWYLPRAHSITLGQAALGLTAAQRDALVSLDLPASLCETCLFDPCPDGTLLVFSPSLDSSMMAYRHRASGVAVPLWFREQLRADWPHQRPEDKAEADRIQAILAAEFAALGNGYPRFLAEMQAALLDAVPAGAFLVVVLPNTRRNVGGTAEVQPQQFAANAAFRRLGEGRANVAFVDATEFVEDIREVFEVSYVHYQRAVHHRIYRAIAGAYERWRAARAAEVLAA